VDWELIESNWREFQRNAQSRWRSLSREDLESIAGQRAKLIAKLRERYGFDEQQAEQELAAWQGALRKVNPFRE
jgi:uncharacterized protein YjbJ (UPF0337 family)